MIRIHREGYGILLKLLLVLVALNTLAVYFYPQAYWLHAIFVIASLGFYSFVLQFFRNPERTTPQEENLVIAPADGKVVVIEEIEEPEYFKDKRKQISIFMSPFNVHCNRSPVVGKVAYLKYHPGLYLLAIHPKSSTENERTTVVFENKRGVKILARQIAGAMARRIRWYVQEEDPLKAGEEFGFIRFGSRVDVFLPLDAEVQVNLEEITKGGETVLAKLP